MYYNVNEITQQTLGQVSSYLARFLQATFIGGADLTPALDPATPWQASIYTLSPLAEQIRELVAYANGEAPASELIADTIQRVAEVLFVAPGDGNAYDIPDHFWSSPLGQVIRTCQVRSRGDDLITYTEAARLLWPDLDPQVARMRLQRMVERDDLTHYTDPAEPNPQRAGRLSRAEIEALQHG